MGAFAEGTARANVGCTIGEAAGNERRVSAETSVVTDVDDEDDDAPAAEEEGDDAEAKDEDDGTCPDVDDGLAVVTALRTGSGVFTARKDCISGGTYLVISSADRRSAIRLTTP